MLNPNDFEFTLRILKGMSYDRQVGFNAWETIRAVFARAWVDYEEWTLGDEVYTPESTLEAGDNNKVIEIAWKQIKQG